jgi:hypothetical protein
MKLKEGQSEAQHPTGKANVQVRLSPGQCVLCHQFACSHFRVCVGRRGEAVSFFFPFYLFIYFEMVSHYRLTSTS